MNPFCPTGPILSFTGASSAPTSVQAVSNDNSVAAQVCLTNADTTNDCVIGWGATDAQAKLNAAAKLSSSCFYLPHGTQRILTVPSGFYYTGIAVASTSVIKVQVGNGGQ